MKPAPTPALRLSIDAIHARRLAERHAARTDRALHWILALALILGGSLGLWWLLFQAILATAPPIAQQIARAVS